MEDNTFTRTAAPETAMRNEHIFPCCKDELILRFPIRTCHFSRFHTLASIGGGIKAAPPLRPAPRPVSTMLRLLLVAVLAGLTSGTSRHRTKI